MPGFSKAYGAQPVNVFCTLDAIDKTHITEADATMGAYFTLTMNFYANNPTTNVTELAATMSFNDTNFAFQAPVSNMQLSLQLVTINVDTITAQYCSWGKIRTAPDKIAINNAMRALIPSINTKLAPLHVNFPDHLG